MPGTLKKVSLTGARFFARHGYYTEEQVTGTEFIVDITVTSQNTDGNPDDIREAINYEQLHHIAAAQMVKPVKLIETVADAILTAIQQLYADASEISVTVSKSNPPLNGQVQAAAVTLIHSR